MRVLQVHTRYRQPGGEDVVVAAEADLLRANGHEVAGYYLDNPRARLASLRDLALAPWNGLAAHRFREMARTFGPDIIHVHNTWFAMSPAVVAAASEQAPVVMTLHNYRLMCANGLLFRDGQPCRDCVQSHPWHAVRHACYRDSRLQSVPGAMSISANRRLNTWDRSVTAMVALTDFARQQFIEAGLPSEKVVVKPHFCADPGPRSRPPSASNELLFVGRVSAEKGLGTVLDALHAIPDLRLTVIGDGPERRQLETVGDDRVTWLGHLPFQEVRERMLAVRALVFPSRWFETFGLVLIEALAAGLPVVASRLGGVADVVGRDAGIFVDEPRREAWVDALRLLEDGARVDEWGQAARRRWKRQYSPTVAAPCLEAIYRLASGGAPSAATLTGR